MIALGTTVLRVRQNDIAWSAGNRVSQIVQSSGSGSKPVCTGLQFKTGSNQRGKKAEVTIKTEYIEEALLDFSGYIAADELYDGPFCVLFIVDNHKFKRLYYAVLNHNHPTNEDITRFFRRFKQMLDARGLILKGITTDGSHIYSEPVANVFGQVKHQSCRFHIIKEITREILKVVTQARRQLKQKKTKRPRGRPCGQQAKQIAQKNQQVKEKIAALFEHRYLFVKHTLTRKERRYFNVLHEGLINYVSCGQLWMKYIAYLTVVAE